MSLNRSRAEPMIQRDLVLALEALAPEVILVTSGFDEYKNDKMSDIKLSTICFYCIMQDVFELDEIHSKGRLIYILKGGYCLRRLPELIMNHIRILLGKEEITPQAFGL